MPFQASDGRNKAAALPAVACAVGLIWLGAIVWAAIVQAKTTGFVGVTPETKHVWTLYRSGLSASYDYEWEGRKYTSSAIVAAAQWPLVWHIDGIAGTTVESTLSKQDQVFVDPTSPERSVLVRGIEPWMVWQASLPLATVLISFGGGLEWLGAAVPGLGLPQLSRRSVMALAAGSSIPAAGTVAYYFLSRGIGWMPGWTGIWIPWAIGGVLAAAVFYFRMEEVEF